MTVVNLVNPADETVLRSMELSTVEDVDEAVDRARASQRV